MAETSGTQVLAECHRLWTNKSFQYRNQDNGNRNEFLFLGWIVVPSGVRGSVRDHHIVNGGHFKRPVNICFSGSHIVPSSSSRIT
ncbi:hypothetical protein CHS0354_029424 [Potamilus streckersoni]|uniref:Uncharacterized protein n=1 Tax=Potamilus streckersoni TaxID=2493646 RepID=A0AAE0SUC6_9BIVA|nr:hypothetical protein CHS0354_029424 [Potamilus streckersoni]